MTGVAAEPRRLAILALLAAADDQELSGANLRAWLWPNAEAEVARRLFDEAISILREDLGAEGVLLGTDGLRLNSELISSDVAEFEEAVSEGKLEVAESRYGGPFLDGFHVPGAPLFQHWAVEARAELARKYAQILEQLGRRALERGDHDGSVQWWRKLAGQDPLNPRVTVHLMRALDAVGEREDALRQARMYEALIARALDSPLDHEVIACAAELRKQDTAAPVQRPAAQA
jgi:DNA-binding SARP family transcriptional activator